MSGGYLLFISTSSPTLEAYRPDGQFAFFTAIQGPGGDVGSVFEAAVDDKGRVAVGVVYAGAENEFKGAIALLDVSGKQTGLILTGRYMPSHLCFGANGALWVSGWQRDAENNRRGDRSPYAVVRRFDTGTKQETGAFVPRSSFPPNGLDPGGAWGGRWMIRAAGDRIGALMMSGQTSERLVWLEMDESGQELGRWTLPADHTDGMAFTAKGLYAVTAGNDREGRASAWQLNLFDKTTSTWKPVATTEVSKDNPDDSFGILMDGEGDELVVARQQGAILEWIRP